MDRSEKILSDIEEYILFLEGQGHTLSLSFYQKHFQRLIPSLVKYDMHPHPVCNYVKSAPECENKCYINKKKLEACSIRHPVFCTCFAGVEEYIFPVNKDGKRLLCIHVSGFAKKSARSRRNIKNTAALFHSNKYSQLIDLLNTAPPDMREVSAFISPLVYMFKMLFESEAEEASLSLSVSPYKTVFLKISEYIAQNFMKDISLKNIAKDLGYSASYLSFVAKKEGGSTIHSMITEIRLENAARLLASSQLSITEVAFACGFGDSNHFSTVFKKKYSLPPLSYKKSMQKR